MTTIVRFRKRDILAQSVDHFYYDEATQFLYLHCGYNTGTWWKYGELAFSHVESSEAKDLLKDLNTSRYKPLRSAIMHIECKTVPEGHVVGDTVYWYNGKRPAPIEEGAPAISFLLNAINKQDSGKYLIASRSDYIQVLPEDIQQIWYDYRTHQLHMYADYYTPHGKYTHGWVHMTTHSRCRYTRLQTALKVHIPIVVDCYRVRAIIFEDLIPFKVYMNTLKKKVRYDPKNESYCIQIKRDDDVNPELTPSFAYIKLIHVPKGFRELLPKQCILEEVSTSDL